MVGHVVRSRGRGGEWSSARIAEALRAWTQELGARTDEQLAYNLKGAYLVVLTGEERARLDALSAPRLRYPYWQQARTAADRLGPADPVMPPGRSLAGFAGSHPDQEDQSEPFFTEPGSEPADAWTA